MSEPKMSESKMSESASTLPWLIWGWLAVLALLLFGIVLPEVLGAEREGYSWRANYLSELGARGTSTARLTNIIGFPAVGFSTLAILLWLWRRLPQIGAVQTGLVCLALGISAGYFGAVIFPCDLGCPVQGSLSQSVHNLLGLVQYPLGVMGFISLSAGLAKRPFLRACCIWAGVAMGIGFVMMILPDQAEFRGAWQRLGDYTAFVVLSLLVVSTRPQESAA